MPYIKLHKPEESASQILANSEVIANGQLVALAGGYVVKAVAATVAPIVGASNQTTTAAANNQTVDKVKVSYTRIEPYDTRFDLSTSAAIAQADVGKYYTLNAGGDLVDVASGNAAKQATSKVRLEALVDGTTTKGTFVSTI